MLESAQQPLFPIGGNQTQELKENKNDSKTRLC